jgi:erythromycin esterase
MKFHLLFSLLLLFSLQGYSQVNVLIGKNNEIVYPVTPDKTNDLIELLPLEKLFIDKKVVAMGEATHGSKEFFNMKAKMFKFLATHCGYRIFSIEATYGGTIKVNDYVLYGKGDVLSAMKGMEFWTWDTEEVKDLIEWMRTFNIGKPEKEKLKFYGFDCQSFKGPTNALIDFVRDCDKPNLDEFVKGLSVLNDSNYRYFHKLNSGQSSLAGIAQVHGIISFIQKWFNGKKDQYITCSGKTKFDLAKHNIEALKQAILLRATPEKIYGIRRDSSMAQNVWWISGFEKEKIFVWAHNGHVCKSPNLFEKHDLTLGMYLDTMFRSDYYTIGFAFKQGNFQALNVETQKPEEYSVPECYKNTLTNALSLAGKEAFFIDLTASNNKLFTTSQGAYFIGGVFKPELWERYSKQLIVKKQFDGLIFINKTSCVVPINRILTN